MNEADSQRCKWNFSTLKSAAAATRFACEDIFLPTIATLQKTSSLGTKKVKQKILSALDPRGSGRPALCEFYVQLCRESGIWR